MRADFTLVRASNPGPLTLEGTNTYLVGRGPCWVVDPGPSLESHVAAINEEGAARGGIGGISLTHDHADHSDAIGPLLDELGPLPVEPAPFFEVVPVPGHSDDHVAFVWEGACFTGDAVLGAGSVFVASRLREYLEALARLRDMDLEVICPGHGPLVLDPRAKLEEYIAHRLDRERRLLEALEAGLREEDDLLDAAWSDAPAHLRGAAALSLRAHMQKLREDGRA